MSNLSESILRSELEINNMYRRARVDCVLKDEARGEQIRRFERFQEVMSVSIIDGLFVT